ncbi:hypothetical protein D3C78_1122400 [compost metagenome]
MADFQEALKRFQPIAVSSIAEDEFRLRLRGLQARMIQQNVKAVWLDASSSLTYYTGLSLGLSERIHGALVPAEGAPVYVSPTFEEPKLQTLIRIPGEVAVWEEDESPFDLMAGRIGALSCPGHFVAIDPATPFVFASALMQRLEGRIISAQPMIVAQRQVKSAAEIALIQTTACRKPCSKVCVPAFPPPKWPISSTPPILRWA